MAERALEKLGLKFYEFGWELYVVCLPEDTPWPKVVDIIKEIADESACDSYQFRVVHAGSCFIIVHLTLVWRRDYGIEEDDLTLVFVFESKR